MIDGNTIFVCEVTNKQIKETHGIFGWILFRFAIMFRWKSKVKEMMHKVRPISDGRTIETAYFFLQEAIDDSLSRREQDECIQLEDEDTSDHPRL